jgi:hypothetical protein
MGRNAESGMKGYLSCPSDANISTHGRQPTDLGIFALRGKTQKRQLEHTTLNQISKFPHSITIFWQYSKQKYFAPCLGDGIGFSAFAASIGRISLNILSIYLRPRGKYSG